ncbi:hypothetical protein NDU88_001681 [Pleurodeles waltl]|uniref:Uncharacterized protein n=1 Tax=Pleurodeles waltl TaxID=8319 RepID=A0AAV7SCA5_PLEWA|nr:hypothetical protein NDU88_001681 [Pleurodeles waltl]
MLIGHPRTTPLKRLGMPANRQSGPAIKRTCALAETPGLILSDVDSLKTPMLWKAKVLPGVGRQSWPTLKWGTAEVMALQWEQARGLHKKPIVADWQVLLDSLQTPPVDPDAQE